MLRTYQYPGTKVTEIHWHTTLHSAILLCLCKKICTQRYTGLRADWVDVFGTECRWLVSHSVLNTSAYASRYKYLIYLPNV